MGFDAVEQLPPRHRHQGGVRQAGCRGRPQAAVERADFADQALFGLDIGDKLASAFRIDRDFDRAVDHAVDAVGLVVLHEQVMAGRDTLLRAAVEQHLEQRLLQADLLLLARRPVHHFTCHARTQPVSAGKAGSFVSRDPLAIPPPERN
jgi:hypothetical protein